MPPIPEDIDDEDNGNVLPSLPVVNGRSVPPVVNCKAVPLAVSCLAVPDWSDDRISLYHSRCEDVIPYLPIGSVDAVITDPPFGIGFKYNSHDDGELSPQESGKWLWSIIEQCESLCTPGSPIMVWQSMTRCRYFSNWFPRDYRIFAACKNFPVAHKEVRLIHSWEPVITWFTPGDGWIPWNNFNSRDYHVANTSATMRETYSLAAEHPCPRPIDQLEHIIRQLVRPGGAVLDPFLGSGTTALACVRNRRKCSGIEKDQTYFDLAVRRIEDYHGGDTINGMRKHFSRKGKR